MSTMTRPEPVVVRRRLPLESSLLIGAPALMIVARLLLVPLDSEDWAATLDAMSAAPGRSDAGFVLAIVASAGLAVCAAALAQRWWTVRRSRLAPAAALLAVLGWAGAAAIGGAGILLSNMAAGTDRAAQLQALAPSADSGWEAVAYFGLCLVGALGYLTLAVGLARAAVISVGAAVLLGLGGAATLITMSGPLRPVLVVAAVLLLAGHGLVMGSER